MSKPVAVMKFDWDNYVIIEDTKGSMDHQYLALVRDKVGIGSGHTIDDAIASLVASLRKTADTIELARKQHVQTRKANGNNDNGIRPRPAQGGEA